MGFCTVIRAIFVRLIFATHGLTAIWRLYMTTEEPRYWYITMALGGLLVEGIVTICVKKGHEWKWFCPSVFFYLLTVVPAVWFLELHEMYKRINLKTNLNTTALFNNETSAEHLSARIESIGFQIVIPLKLTSDQWLRTLEQLLLLFLILGRWLLPKGKLTHDQLSQLLLVYIGTAADIVEFFEAFKEDEVKYNTILCMTILSIWSWSLLQFSMVLTATKARKDQSGVYNKPERKPGQSCCTPDVYGIIISIMMQDAPFLILRLLLIFKYKVVSYTNMFFTCKNALVVMLLMYRLIVVQIERRKPQKKKLKLNHYMHMSESTSKIRLITNGDKNKHKKTNINDACKSQELEIPVQYEIKRHISRENVEPPAYESKFASGDESDFSHL